MSFRPATLVEMLRARAGDCADRTAYLSLDGHGAERERVTFAALDRQARAIAARLQGLDLAGEPVLLLFPSGIDFIAAFFGCAYAGAIGVPCYHSSRDAGRLPAIIASAGIRVVLASDALMATVRRAMPKELDALTWLCVEDIAADEEEGWRPPALTADATAYLQYSSGSTGHPKGIMVSHGNALHNLEMTARVVEHDAQRTSIVTWLPHFHDMGLIGTILPAAYVGVQCVLLSPVNFLKRPLLWLQTISRYRATFSGAPNFAYDLCVRRSTPEQRAGLDLSTWELAFNGAEPVRAEVIDAFVEAFGPHGFRRETFFACYGLAEATLLVTGRGKSVAPAYLGADRAALEEGRVVAAGDAGARKLVSCGSAWSEWSGQRIAIVDPQALTPCAADRVGEIWVSGPSVAQGYWGLPKETASTFVPALEGAKAGPFLRTGDLGFVQDGELYVTGRLKDLVIIHGRNHAPEDIERTVYASNDALQPECGAAFSIDAGGEERLVVVQELRRERRDDFDEERIRGDVIEAIAATHQVKLHALVLIPCGSMPKTSSGKIQRRACRDAFLAGTLPGLGRPRRVPRLASSPTVDGAGLRRAQQLHAFAISGLSLAVVVAAVALALRHGVGAVELGLLAVLYALTMLGITVGYHRMLSHRAFEAGPAVRAVLAVLGAMAAQGSPLYWVANHRRHHQFSDAPGDPHSPRFNGEQPIRGLKAFWHAHVGWMFTHELSNALHYCKDLIRDPVVSRISRHYYAIVVAGLALPALLGGLLTSSAQGALGGLLWGGFARIFLTYHFASCINSVTHMFGSRPFQTPDHSRNNAWIALPTMGEAWHNNHHAFPSSAYFGMKAMQVDLGGYVIWLLERLSLVRNVRRASAERVATRLAAEGAGGRDG